MLGKFKTTITAKLRLTIINVSTSRALVHVLRLFK
jgi:hypothetical protein